MKIKKLVIPATLALSMAFSFVPTMTFPATTTIAEASAYQAPATTAVKLAKGEVTVYDFGSIKLHSYKTNDVLSDECYVLEGKDGLVLLESTAFGCRKIIDTLESSGVGIDTLIATGGIPHKNPLMMQIYADVMGRDVLVVDRDQTGSVGSAIMGAAAAGDGFPSLAELTEKYALPFSTVYHPDPGSSTVYEGLYKAYCDMYSFFGEKDSLLHRLKDIRKEARGN